MLYPVDHVLAAFRPKKPGANAVEGLVLTEMAGGGGGVVGVKDEATKSERDNNQLEQAAGFAEGLEGDEAAVAESNPIVSEERAVDIGDRGKLEFSPRSGIGEMLDDECSVRVGVVGC